MSLCGAFLFTHGEYGCVRIGLGIVGTTGVVRHGTGREKRNEAKLLFNRRNVISTHSIEVTTPRLMHAARL